MKVAGVPGARFEPGVEPLLPSLPAHLAPAAATHQPRVAVRLAQTAALQVSCLLSRDALSSSFASAVFHSFPCVLRDLELAIPGSYVPNQPVIRISQVRNRSDVVPSPPSWLDATTNVCVTESMFLPGEQLAAGDHVEAAAAQALHRRQQR